MKRYWKKNRGILMLALLLGTCASIFTTGVSLILQAVVDAAVTKQTELFGKLFLLTVVYILFLCALNYLSSVTAKYLTARMIRQYRQDIFSGIMRRQPVRYHAENTSSYVSALTNDIKLVEENYISALLLTFELIIMFVATLGVLIFLSPVVMAILVFALLLMLLLPAAIGCILEKRQDLVSKQMSHFTGKLKDFFSGYEVLKSYNRIENTIVRFADDNEQEITMKLKAARLFALNEGLSDTLSVLSTVAVIFSAAYLVLAGHITMGTLLALVQLSSTFMTPVILLMQNIPKIQSMKPILARLDAYAKNEAGRKHPEGIPTFAHVITLERVSFSYDGHVPLLVDVTLRLEKGKKYAIMGRSGCGKSTLIKLLLGHFDNYSGGIWYDGQELRSLDPDKIAALSSVIHQDIYLFCESLRDNILLHEGFSAQDLKNAIEKSGAASFIAEKEDGLDCITGENGAALSGGQKQRIALARAFIRRAPLLILDEGTSALDGKTAYDIESRLLHDDDITLLTVTHHPNPDLLAQYDAVYDLENGRLKKRQA